MSKYTRTTISLVVLSENPIPDDFDVADIMSQCDTGDYVLASVTNTAVPLSPYGMATALSAAGSEPGFFSLDDDGNSVIDA